MRSALTVTAGWFDYDNDGWLDLLVTHYVAWTEVAAAVGVANSSTTISELSQDGRAVAGMGADFRDADDGFDDIAMTAMYYDTFPFFRNRGPRGSFEDVTLRSGVATATFPWTGWSLGMYDFDNDGFKDIFAATSHFPGSEPYVGSVATVNRVLRGAGHAAFEDVSRYAGPTAAGRAVPRGGLRGLR